MKTLHTLVVVTLGLTASGALAESPHWIVKDAAGSDWQWFEDYASFSSTYSVACNDGRSCQVGMGVFAFGAPRGEKIRFTGTREITTLGFGSIHIRMDDGKGPGKAAILPGAVTPLTYTVPW